MKKIISVLLVLLMVASLAFAQAAGEEKAAPAAATKDIGDKLVVYFAGSQDQADLMTDLWKEVYPNCELEFVMQGSGELTARIEAEKDLPQGDIMYGGSFSIYSGLEQKGLLQPYLSPVRSECLKPYSGDSDLYTAIQLNVNTIIVNNAMVKNLEITVDGWESLLNEKLKGSISYVDPSASSSAREQVINMLCALATRDGDKMDDHWDFIKAFYRNLDGKMYSSSSKVPQGVANGEYAVGITNEELVLQLMLDGVDVSPIYAKEGITLRNSFTGIIANCQHLEAAKAFIDFAISKDVQQACADELLMRSVRPDVAFNALEGIPSSGELPALDYPQEWVNANPKLKAALQAIIAEL